MLSQKLAWALLVLLSISLLFTSSSVDGAGMITLPSISKDDPIIVKVEIASIDAARDLNAFLDVWEVHPEDGHIVARVRPADVERLELLGYPVQIVAIRSNYPDTIPDYPCYRTVAELYADLDTIVNNHPGITELSTIGHSYDNWPIKVLRITNQAIAGDKPKLFLMANIHGRELITSETAIAFIEYLLQNYGSDPNVTWVVDQHEIHVVVTTNPDGHFKNEPGEPWTWWRKNTDPTGCAIDDSYGVDLNRNHSFEWGCCNGSSIDPCYPTYRGPSAASEIETQVVQNYVSTLFPDQRGEGDNDSAPEDATGVLITLHSYGNLVLWPWGFTNLPAPNSEGLAAFGRKMTQFNLYSPGQAYSLYPTDGTTDDWTYGELGVAAYTFEIGLGTDGFYPSCDRYNDLVEPNISAIFYAAKVVRTPYLTAQGPDALNLEIVPDPVLLGQTIQLSASIDDDHNGSVPIEASEYFVDEFPWNGGQAQSLNPVDGNFDSVKEDVSVAVSTVGLSLGRHTIFVRGQDQDGFWGPVSAIELEIQQGYWVYLPIVTHE